jgi:hypothetical protein
MLLVEFMKAWQPTKALPPIADYATATVVQAATTRLECSIVESMKHGGLQRHRFLAQAIKDFSLFTDQAGPSETVHPCLLPHLKLK